jgi:hypothetical protein
MSLQIKRIKNIDKYKKWTECLTNFLLRSVFFIMPTTAHDFCSYLRKKTALGMCNIEFLLRICSCKNILKLPFYFFLRITWKVRIPYALNVSAYSPCYLLKTLQSQCVHRICLRWSFFDVRTYKSH